MNSSLGITTLILSLVACVGLILVAWQIRSFRRLKHTFFAGTQAVDLEHIIYSLVARMDAADNRQDALENELVLLGKHTAFALQKVGVVRFNPFEEGGGNFSFCIAFLNDHNSGLVLTSMHGRQQCRVYTKRITEGKCEMQLTAEEKQAIQQALETAAS